jgi:transcriptional regulator with XRE-family HTH domain
MHTETKNTGTYERPAPKDIAFMVKELRGYFGWKQLALADEAGVTERTIERIEAGTPVSDDTLRKVAKALKLRDGAFTEAGYCPSEAELIAEVKKIRDQHTVTELHTLPKRAVSKTSWASMAI